MYCRTLFAIILSLSAAAHSSAAKPKAKPRKATVDVEAVIAEARQAVSAYDFDVASQLMERYFDNLGDRNPEPDAAILAHTAEMGNQMLERVEDVVVVDSIIVDKERFFESYRLSTGAGSFRPGDLKESNTPVYVTQNGLTEFFADKSGRLASARILADGNREEPRLYDNSEGIDEAAYPFLMPDGITLYFGARGEASLGGYDIFITRRGGVDEDFLQPQNIGMPFNSPADDYLLAIDEATGLGWWATDRNNIPGKVTIYIFIPAELRNNIDPSHPDLLSRAQLTSIKDTQPSGFSKPDIARLVAEASPMGAVGEFEFALPGGRIVTSLSEVPSGRPRQLLREWLESSKSLEQNRRRLADMRRYYAGGNRSQTEEILRLEQSIETDAVRLANLRNEAVKAIGN